MDEKILLKIIEIHKISELDFLLSMGSNIFPLKNVTITKTPTPVNRPTSRGGVYFSDTFAFKIKAQVADLSIAPLLSKSMLGPNADFEDLKIITNANIDDKLKKVILFAHLTNSMQSSSFIELNMTITKLACE